MIVPIGILVERAVKFFTKTVPEERELLVVKAGISVELSANICRIGRVKDAKILVGVALVGTLMEVELALLCELEVAQSIQTKEGKKQFYTYTLFAQLRHAYRPDPVTCDIS